MTEKDKDISKAVADTVEKEVKEPVEKTDTITFSTGVVLKVKNASLGLLTKVYASFKRPEAPKYFNEEHNRMFENPDHPDHIGAVKDFEAKSSEVMLNAIIALATEVESVPKGMSGHKSNGWIQLFESLGLETHPENEYWRYQNWVLLNAIVTTEDFRKMTEIAQLSGIAISEEAVQKAANFSGSD